MRYHVTDTGVGITPDKVERVFDRFVKANNFAQGTGLGLSICKTIVERLGGRISVASEIGKGTIFTFFLPMESAEKKVMEKAAAPDTDVPTVSSYTDEEGKQPATFEKEVSETQNPEQALAAPAIILVAEDTESNYILIKAILGRIYHLEHARDGMEAVTMFEEVHPDLILMDIKMPNLNGLDATRIIREIAPEVPIIALTSYAYEHDRQTAFDAGCNDFLTKPFTQEVLKETIRKWLEG